MPRDFLKEIHVIEKHCPWGNDNSAFKATLNPSSGILQIELRIRYVFPSFWRFFHPTMSSPAFKKKLANMVDNVWSGRYAISITGNSDQRKVKIQTKVLMIESGEDAHFTINVQYLGSGRSYVSEDSCTFYTGVVNYKPSALAMKIGYRMAFGAWSHDRAIYRDVERYTKSRIERSIHFEKNSLDPTDSNSAKDVAMRMKEHADVWPLLPLRLTGYRLRDEALDSSKKRAEKFKRALIQATAPNSSIEVKDGGVDVSKGHPYVKLEVGNARSAFLNRANNFPIAAHEVGHMLGLADEYEPEEAAQVINRYAERAGVSVPPFLQNTSSLMSQGDKILPYHYLPFHETISTMALNFRRENRNDADARNGEPIIKIEKNLLRNSDPEELDTIDISGLFASGS